jgi:hypothetical protein
VFYKPARNCHVHPTQAAITAGLSRQKLEECKTRVTFLFLQTLQRHASRKFST